jgi:transposase
MKRIPKQEYTVQFKDQAVAMVKGGKTVPEVARALGLVEQTLRNWVKLAAKGKLYDGAKEITPEREEPWRGYALWSCRGCAPRTRGSSWRMRF